jgi:uncharacterized membrane protein YoaK (UPF0700 family)
VTAGLTSGISPTGRDVRLLTLTLVAGMVDAVSYLGPAHVFTAMMTGNTVLLGLALGAGEALHAFRSALALLGFMAGVAVGEVVVGRDEIDEPWPRVVTQALALEAAVLAAFAAFLARTPPAPDAALVHVQVGLLSIAMGIQSAAVRRLGVPGIATTYITGTLTSLMVGIVEHFRVTGPLRVVMAPLSLWETRTGVLAAVFVVYVVGALLGSVLYGRVPAFAAVPALVAVVAIAVSGWRSR